jgi:hypothetical protein
VHMCKILWCLFNVLSINTTTKAGISSMKTNRCWGRSYLYNVSVDSATCFDLQFRSSSSTFLWSITQVIKVNSHDMDPYATDVYCCMRIYIYKVSTDICSNILIKF